MATLTQLQKEVVGWLDRGDLDLLLPGWVAMVETDIAELLRAKCMIARSVQPIDAAHITLPVDFIEMESLKDAQTGKLLSLEDHFSGPDPHNPAAASAYRVVGDCLEFLPYPQIPDPPPADYVYQRVEMVWFQKPKPLLDPQDSNVVLENHYAVYLWGMLRYGAKYELDERREKQADAEFTGACTAANYWKVAAQYSGAPLRAVRQGF